MPGPQALLIGVVENSRIEMVEAAEGNGLGLRKMIMKAALRGTVLPF